MLNVQFVAWKFLAELCYIYLSLLCFNLFYLMENMDETDLHWTVEIAHKKEFNNIIKLDQ